MSKSLVAYFSASSVTIKLEKALAAAVSGKLHEIQPVHPYRAADSD